MRDDRKCTSWATGGTRARTSATDTVAKTNQYLGFTTTLDFPYVPSHPSRISGYELNKFLSCRKTLYLPPLGQEPTTEAAQHVFAGFYARLQPLLLRTGLQAMRSRRLPA